MSLLLGLLQNILGLDLLAVTSFTRKCLHHAFYLSATVSSNTLYFAWPVATAASLPSLESCVVHLLVVLLLGACPVSLYLDKEPCEKKDAVISFLDPTQLA